MDPPGSENQKTVFPEPPFNVLSSEVRSYSANPSRSSSQASKGPAGKMSACSTKSSVVKFGSIKAGLQSLSSRISFKIIVPVPVIKVGKCSVFVEALYEGNIPG